MLMRLESRLLTVFRLIYTKSRHIIMQPEASLDSHCKLHRSTETRRELSRVDFTVVHCFNLSWVIFKDTMDTIECCLQVFVSVYGAKTSR